jgi:hypothetical protein
LASAAAFHAARIRVAGTGWLCDLKFAEPVHGLTSNFSRLRTPLAFRRAMEQNQAQYQGPERRKSQAQYNGKERRRLDWPFKPANPKQPDEGIARTSTPGRGPLP